MVREGEGRQTGRQIRMLEEEGGRVRYIRFKHNKHVLVLLSQELVPQRVWFAGFDFLRYRGEESEDLGRSALVLVV